MGTSRYYYNDGTLCTMKVVCTVWVGGKVGDKIKNLPINMKELEGDMGDANVGLQARLMSQALRKLTGAINESKCIVVFINQLREKVGVMFGQKIINKVK